MKSNQTFFRSLWLLMVISSSSIGQVVNIPDSNFKYKLINHNPIIDINQDGEIQLSEAKAYNGSMNISYDTSDPDYIEDVTGLEAFTNLEEFVASYQNIQTIDVSENFALKLFNASGNDFIHLSFTNHPMLEAIQVNFGQLKSLDVSGAPNLINLMAQGNNLTLIDLSHNPILEGINLDNNPILAYDFSQNASLRFVNCRNNSISQLDLSSCPLLIAIDCQDNSELTYLNLKNGNNEGLNLGVTGPNCAFYNVPLLETVCLDAIDSPLADYIEEQVGHAITFQEECFLSINEMSPLNINIHPNPTDGIFYIKSESTVTCLQLYDSSGKLIITNAIGSNDYNMDISHLSPGIYFLVIGTIGENQQTVKLLKK